MDIKKMRTCSDLLPGPGGEVVRECLDEIERLRAVLTEIQEEAGHMLPSGNDPTSGGDLAHLIYLMTMRGLEPNNQAHRASIEDAKSGGA